MLLFPRKKGKDVGNPLLVNGMTVFPVSGGGGGVKKKEGGGGKQGKKGGIGNVAGHCRPTRLQLQSRPR